MPSTLIVFFIPIPIEVKRGTPAGLGQSDRPVPQNCEIRGSDAGPATGDATVFDGHRYAEVFSCHRDSETESPAPDPRFISRSESPQDCDRIRGAIALLGQEPRPPGAKARQGRLAGLRVPVGDYRIIYTVDDSVLVVAVITLRHRRDVYER